MEFNKQIKKIYMLYHINERKDTKLIGFFSNKEKIEKLKQELITKSGFKDYPQGFKIRTMIVDKNYYTKGFKSKYL